jgi:hypothetical protein
MHLSALTPQSSKYTAGAIMAGAITVVEVITMDGAIITIGETKGDYFERSRLSRAAFSWASTALTSSHSCYAYREVIDALSDMAPLVIYVCLGGWIRHRADRLRLPFLIQCSALKSETPSRRLMIAGATFQMSQERPTTTQIGLMVAPVGGPARHPPVKDAPYRGGAVSVGDVIKRITPG